MKHIVVTGVHGFIGRHVASLLAYDASVNVMPVDRGTTSSDVRTMLSSADAVIHLAGVNRPRDEHEFEVGNAQLTRSLTEELLASGRKATLVFASTSRAEEDTPYGRSKLAAEAAVRYYGERSGASVSIYRLPNVFGNLHEQMPQSRFRLSAGFVVRSP